VPVVAHAHRPWNNRDLTAGHGKDATMGDIRGTWVPRFDAVAAACSASPDAGRRGADIEPAALASLGGA